MCHFITEILPDNVDPAIYNDCFKPLDRTLRPIDNRTVMAQLKPGFRYYCGATDMCDCGTVIGSMVKIKAAELEARIKAKELRKKKWPESRINAFLAQENKTQRKHSIGSNGNLAIAKQWLDCIREFLVRSQAKRVGLLLHWYHGRLEKERIVISNFRELRVGNLQPEVLMQFGEDVVFWFML